MNEEYILWGTAIGLSMFTTSLLVTNLYRGYKARKEQEPLRKELERLGAEMSNAMDNLERTVDKFGSSY